MVARRAKGDDDDGAGPKSVVPRYNSKLYEERVRRGSTRATTCESVVSRPRWLLWGFFLPAAYYSVLREGFQEEVREDCTKEWRRALIQRRW